MSMFLKFACLAATLLALLTPGFAQGLGSRVEWSTGASSIAPGDSFTVALQLHHPAGWHSYYKNSGGIEQSPSITWTLPEGMTADGIEWPTPEVKDGYAGKSFVYTGAPTFLVRLHAPQNAEVGSALSFSAKAHWQICENACIDENAEHAFTLPVASQTQRNEATAARIEQARAALPAPLSGRVSAEADGEAVVLHLPGIPQPSDFVPDQPYLKAASDGGSIEKSADGWSVRLPRSEVDFFDNPIPQGDHVSGVFLGEKPLLFPDTPIASGGGAVSSAAKKSATPQLGLIATLVGMFLGGLILNLMPCVFPVIGLKIMGFVQQAGGDRKHIVLHGLAFTAGVFALFAVLAGILFSAKQTWGYQLQNPWVVLGIMVLMFVLAMNMFGVMELGTSATSIGGNLQNKSGTLGSFFTGVLATVVATPCSAPFLGKAITEAVSLPTAGFFSAFACMALGLSTPYLILSAFPQLVEKLPRPGPWMESMKQGMSFLLFATAGYMLWVYTGQIDHDNMLGPVFGLTLIGIACWIFGRWNLPHKSATTRRTALALTVLFAVGGIFLAKPPAKSELVWEPWSQDQVDAVLAEGKPVYIDFTAKWCATCQYNKKRAYTPEVIAALRKHDIATFRADKTKPSAAIDQAIKRYGREAIPVNVLEAPGNPPIILPEVLGPGDILKAIDTLE